MQKFVDNIAEYIKNQNIALQDWTIILPSQRATQYVQKALFEAYNQPVLSPDIFTVYRWIQGLVPETVLDKIRLILRLYNVHTKNHNNITHENSFDEFMKWGNILLSDFDELDRYLVDYKQLFRNLRDIKELENWSFGNENLSESQKKFIEFWDKLPQYYVEFNQLLEKENTTYMGKAYRKVAQEIDLVFKKNPNTHYLFAGFNALSPAEMSIFSQLHQMGRGHILIDADEYYLKDKNHEAGMFMRNMMEKLSVKELPFIQKKLSSAVKMAEIIACSQTSGQAKVAGTLLERFSEVEIKETMILLADESLIVPLLKNLPKKVGKANITLGLPLKNTALRTWIELTFRIQESIEKQGKISAYHKDLMTCWNHPFVLAILNENEIREIQQREIQMRKFNTVFQNPDKVEVPQLVKEIIHMLYTPWKDDWNVALKSIRSLNQKIYNQLKKENEFEKALIEIFDKSIVDFQNCIAEDIPPMKLRTFKMLFNQQWATASIAYYGNPIDGLQIMGLLETRLLDFKRIIVIGMNEGKMPPTNPIQTLIPMDLRKYFELPTPREKQGLFAHHFYRLLHVCEEIYITYTTSTESIGSNEASRYLMQLELELARQNPNFKLVKRDYTIDSEASESKHVSIEKTPAVIQRLDELFETGTSASAIKTFITCPLDFYYKYVLKFGEEKKIEEEIESNTFGTFIHEVLEDLYAPFSRRENNGELKTQQPPSLQPEDIDKMLKQYDYLLRQKFSNHFNNNPEAFEKGKNYLSYSMAKELLERFLKFEKTELLKSSNAPFFIEALEQEFHHTLELEIHGQLKNIHLKGFADRIDSKDGAIRIVDYKTGKVEHGDVGKAKLGDMNDPLGPSSLQNLYETCIKSKHFFQLLVYNFLYFQKHAIYPETSSIISFVKLNDSPFNINLGNLKVEEAVTLFPDVMKLLLEDIYNMDTPFEHDFSKYQHYCEYCQ